MQQKYNLLFHAIRSTPIFNISDSKLFFFFCISILFSYLDDYNYFFTFFFFFFYMLSHSSRVLCDLKLLITIEWEREWEGECKLKCVVYIRVCITYIFICKSKSMTVYFFSVSFFFLLSISCILVNQEKFNKENNIEKKKTKK